VPARAEHSEENGIDKSHRSGETVGRDDQFDESVEDTESEKRESVDSVKQKD